VRGRPTVIALLGLSLLGLLGACAPLPPGAEHWAEAHERERCLREGNWWRPSYGTDGRGWCDRINDQL
jgi:hypothetical protein